MKNIKNNNIKTLGYVEGYFDGKNNIIEELVKLKLLKKGWKGVYNKNTKSNYIIK